MGLLLGVLIVVVCLGCADGNASGGGGGGGGGGGVTVSVSPPSVNVAVGGTQQFSAVVSGSSDGAVTWTVSPRGLAYDPARHAYLMAVHMNGANQRRGILLVNRVTAP